MITTVTRKNMVTIPAELSRKMGITPGCRLEWREPEEGSDEVRVRVLPTRGELARRIAADLAKIGSPVAAADLQQHQARRRTPLSVPVRGARLFNFPPPTQGLSSLMILALFDRLGVSEAEGFDFVHGLVEATKQAFLVRDRIVGDPDAMPEPPEEYLTAAESTKRLGANTIDAVFMPLIAPSPEAGAAAAAGARMLDIAGPNVERLRLQHPFLLRTRLAQNTYPGQTKAVQTIAVDLLLVCRADTDESLVYSVLKAYFDDLAKSTIAIDLNRASAMSIPLHAGAARYYRER